MTPADRLAEIANRTPRFHPDIWIEAHGPAVCLTRAEHEWIVAELARVTAANARLREAIMGALTVTGRFEDDGETFAFPVFVLKKLRAALGGTEGK